MKDKISITKDSGDKIESTVSAAFKLLDNSKIYYVTTENLLDPHDLTILHVSELVENTLNKIATDEEWNSIKGVMRLMISGTKGNYEFVPFKETLKGANTYSRDISVSASGNKQMHDNYMNSLAENTPKTSPELKLDLNIKDNLGNVADLGTGSENVKKDDSSASSTTVTDAAPVAPVVNSAPVVDAAPVAPVVNPAPVVDAVPVAPVVNPAPVVDAAPVAPAVSSTPAVNVTAPINVNASADLEKNNKDVKNIAPSKEIAKSDKNSENKSLEKDFDEVYTHIITDFKTNINNAIDKLIKDLSEKVATDLEQKEMEIKNREMFVAQKEMAINNQMNAFVSNFAMFQQSLPFYQQQMNYGMGYPQQMMGAQQMSSQPQQMSAQPQMMMQTPVQPTVVKASNDVNN